MNIDRDVTPLVRSWLEGRGEALADPSRGFDRFLALVDATPQVRRRPWAPGPPAATRHPARRSPSMFSATRVIAAVAVVALGTGALFLAASTDPSPVPTVAPSPAWTPPPGLVTEELAPGIVLATDDGAGHSLGDAADPDAWVPSELAFAPDGGVWRLHDGELIRLGDPTEYPSPRMMIPATIPFTDLTAAPDGTLWALSSGTVASYRDSTWVTAPRFPGGDVARALEVLPDGTVWARSASTLARLDGHVWSAHEIVDDRGRSSGYVFPGDLAATSDGSLWVTLCRFRARGTAGLLRFDGRAFEPIEPPIPVEDCIAPIAAAPGSELWAFLENSGHPALARFDGSALRVAEGDTTPGIQTTGGAFGFMAVAPDGRLWATGGTRDNRLVIGFHDGKGWTDVYAWPMQQTDPKPDIQPPLELPIAIAPDGSVWLPTNDGILITDPETAIGEP